MTRAGKQLTFTIVTAAALLITGAATAYAAGVPGMAYPGLLAARPSRGGSGSGTAAAAASDLSVTGSPAVAPNGGFSHGARVAWSDSPSDLGMMDGQGLNYVAGNGATWVIQGVGRVAGNGQQGPVLAGVDPATGRQVWRSPIGPLSTVAARCAPELLGSSVVCVASPSRFGDDSAATLEEIGLSNGAAGKQADLSSLGISPGDTVDSIHVFDGTVVLRTYNSSGTAGQSSGGTVVRIAGDLSKTVWKATFTRSCGGNHWTPVYRQYGDLLVLTDSQASVALDFASGKLLANPACAEMDQVGKDGLMLRGGVAQAGEQQPVQLSNGRTVAVFSTSAGMASSSTSIVNFSASGLPSPVPLAYSVSGDTAMAPAPEQAQAYGPGGAALWSNPVEGTAIGLRDGFYGAWDGTHLILVDSTGHITSVDPKTGAALWANSYPAPSRGEDEASATAPQPMFASDGTLLVADADADAQIPMLMAFNPATGAKLWEQDGSWFAANSFVGKQPAVVLRGAVSTESVSALVPASAASAAATAPALPAGMPSCPAGMSPVSWSAYPGGHILLCGGGGRYTVQYRLQDHNVSCSALVFTSSGFRLTCRDGSVVASGGGAVLQVSSGKSSWVVPAATSWAQSTGAGPVGFSDAVRIPHACPAGSFPISLSTWRGGWLLICGTDADHVTQFLYSNGGDLSQGETMALDAGRYCGKTTSGMTVCMSLTPALVTTTQPGGSPVQQSVPSNYSGAGGFGGTGKGTGAYGVSAPNATANDQVRYLVQILQKSQQGRSEVSDLVAQMLQCSVSASDVTTAADVVANRSQLVTALQSTPFDHVPNGQQLITQLTTALQVSLQADQQYLTAVKQMVGGDCDTGIATTHAAMVVADQTDALKQTFVDDWNANIAGKYPGAGQFSASTI